MSLSAPTLSKVAPETIATCSNALEHLSSQRQGSGSLSSVLSSKPLEILPLPSAHDHADCHSSTDSFVVKPSAMTGYGEGSKRGREEGWREKRKQIYSCPRTHSEFLRCPDPPIAKIVFIRYPKHCHRRT